MRLNKKVLGITVLAIGTVVALLFLALPPLVKYLAIRNIDESTGRKSAIRELSINPFTLSAAVSGVRLSEKGSSAPFFTLSSARISLSPASLPKRSFIVTELRLVSPYLHLVRTTPNRYNFSDMLAPKKEEKKGTPLFSLNNIIISNASIDFQDQALKVEKLHRIRQMQLSLPFVTNISYLADRYVSPHFSAVINGSPVRFDGRLKPLTKAVEASFQINLKGIDLPYYLGYVPFPLPVQIHSGRLATALDLGYRVDEKTGPELRGAGKIALEQLSVREKDGKPLGSLQRGELQVDDLLLLARRASVNSLELDRLELYADRDRRGTWNFQKLEGSQKPKEEQGEAKPAAKTEKAKAEKPYDVKVARFTLKGGAVHVVDAVPPGGFKTELKEIELTLRDFSNAKGHQTPLDLGFRSSRGESAKLSGTFGSDPAEARMKLSLEGVHLKDYYPYLHDTLTSPVAGTLALSAQLLYTGSQGIVIEEGALRGEGIAASYGSGEGIRLQELLVSGVSVDLKRKKAAVERVDLRGGSIALSSEKGGRISAEGILKKSEETSPAKASAARSRHPKESSQPFSYRIEKVSGSGLAVKYTDKSNRHAPQFNLNRLNFTLSKITGPRLGTIPVRIDAGFGRRGNIRAAGNFTAQPLGYRGTLQLQGIALRDFDAYIPENTTVFIVEGALDTTLGLNVEKHGDGFRGSFNGSAGVHSFYCQDTASNEDLLKWERLQLERFRGTISPFTLAVSGVSLSNSYSRVIVQKDGTLNLQHLVREEAPQRPQAAKPVPPRPTRSGPPPAVAPGAESPAQPHPIRVDAITVQGGTIAFSDRHLEAPFDTTFYNVGGRVSGLSSEANRAADVDLRGNLENHSPLSINGKVNPLRGDLYLDLRITFNDIELSPLTPYTATYLGYGVDKGKLFLDLSYKIDKKALTSTNKVFIDQFSFGKAIPSAKATKLPVRLAVALLKDRKGEIRLDLPVAGRTDNPEFSVWRVVLQILKNLVVKAATSPLALLGSMFGSGEDFSAVYFQPGSERLVKAEQEKLEKLAKALHDRPALNLEISGFVDRDRDPEGYRSELLLKKMKGEKFRKMVKEGTMREGQTPEETEILPQEYPLYLKEVYVKEKFPKPRNFLGILKDISDPEMKKLIFAHTEVGNNELQGLARQRSEAVKAFLMKEGKLPPERLFEKSADIYKPVAKGETSASRVEFGASAK
jgi:uncharacterized protein involved in outer membrane biogenesis